MGVTKFHVKESQSVRDAITKSRYIRVFFEWLEEERGFEYAINCLFEARKVYIINTTSLEYERVCHEEDCIFPANLWLIVAVEDSTDKHIIISVCEEEKTAVSLFNIIAAESLHHGYYVVQ